MGSLGEANPNCPNQYTLAVCAEAFSHPLRISRSSRVSATTCGVVDGGGGRRVERQIMNRPGAGSLQGVRRYIRDGNLFRENSGLAWNRLGCQGKEPLHWDLRELSPMKSNRPAMTLDHSAISFESRFDGLADGDLVGDT